RVITVSTAAMAADCVNVTNQALCLRHVTRRGGASASPACRVINVSAVSADTTDSPRADAHRVTAHTHTETVTRTRASASVLHTHAGRSARSVRKVTGVTTACRAVRRASAAAWARARLSATCGRVSVSAGRSSPVSGATAALWATNASQNAPPATATPTARETSSATRRWECVDARITTSVPA
ncbi:hypothetical protein M9458_047275, partial [Cirrhinus mrigala]